MVKIEDSITKINSAQDGQQAFDIFAGIMKQLGYDRVAYGFATDHKSLGIKRQHGLATSFPDEWMSYYQKNNLIEIDPIPNYAMKNSVPSFWKPIEDSLIEGQSLQILRDAADCGLVDGAIIPLYSKGGDVAGLSLSSETLHENADLEMLAKIQFIATYFHEKYKSFIAGSYDVKLSDKELQILIWAAEGKTDEEIALIINRSKPAVRYHWGRIYQKLDAFGKIAAITKAIRFQLITPYHILKNYHK